MAWKDVVEAAHTRNTMTTPRRRSSPRRQRMEWSDEERLYTPLTVTIIVFNGLFLLSIVLGFRALWANPNPQVWDPAGHNHEIRDTIASPPPNRMHASRRWAAIKREDTQSTIPIQAFQVDVPLLGQGGMVVGAGTPDGFSGIDTTVKDNSTACQVTLAVHTFASSYGSPFVGNYTPPDCMGDSNTAVMNLTVQSQGRQYDRLFILYFGNTEMFRSSTEEPGAQGISWTYMKDMSQFMSLWKQPQTVIFDLPNSVNEMLTGTYNTTLTVSFFNAPFAVKPADTIIPISARQGDNSKPSVFTIPSDTPASNVVSDFPRNAARAIFSVSATGQGDEEFWWSNVLESNTHTYNASGATLFGFSPFREVQVLIDGQLAGVQWPFPIIFTGGVVPSFWDPMVGIDVFDLKEGEIDITPWLGVLCDGQSHNFTINVVGLNDTGETDATLSTGVNSNWQVTGKIFIWLDPDSNAVTTGDAPTITGADPTISVGHSLITNSTGFNDTLQYNTSITRQLTISGSITTSLGTNSASWSQIITHSDYGLLTNQGSNQINQISTQGTDASTANNGGFSKTYSYPMTSNQTTTLQANGTTRFDAIISRTKSETRSVPPPPSGDGGNSSDATDNNNMVTAIYPSGLQLFAVLPATADLAARLGATSRTTTQSGAASLFLDANGVTRGFGNQMQQLRFGGVNAGDVKDAGGATGWMGDEPDSELYFRDVSVSSEGTILSDTERLAGQDTLGDRPPASGLGAPPKTDTNVVVEKTENVLVDERLLGVLGIHRQ